MRLFALGEVGAPHTQKEKKLVLLKSPVMSGVGPERGGPSPSAISRGAGLALTTWLPWALSEHVT